MTTKKIHITDNNTHETIDMDTERIVNWMRQGQEDCKIFDAAFARWDDIEATVEAGDIAALDEILSSIDDTVRVKAVPATVECACGYSWTPRVAEPKSCPRCKKRLD